MTPELEVKFSGRTYNLHMDNALIFVGGNHYYKNEIYKVIQRYIRYGSYSSLELDFFGGQAISVNYDGKKLISKDNDFITIESMNDLSNEFEYKRGTLLFHKINSLKENYDVGQALYKVNDALIELESSINQNISFDSDMINLHFDEFILEDIFKNVLNITHLRNEVEIPTYFLKLENTIKKFLVLIEHRLQTSSCTIWLLFNNPESYFKSDVFLDFFNKLKKMSEETGRLKLLVFHFRNVSTYDETLLDSTVLVLDTVEQLPEADIFYKSIERYYPSELTDERKDIFNAFYRICNYIGDDQISSFYLKKKDMVLLYVLKDMLNDDSFFEVLDDDLTPLEEKYLKNKEDSRKTH